MTCTCTKVCIYICSNAIVSEMHPSFMYTHTHAKCSRPPARCGLSMHSFCLCARRSRFECLLFLHTQLTQTSLSHLGRLLVHNPRLKMAQC